MEIMQDYVIWILITLLFTLKLKIFNKNIANDVERWFDTSNYDKKDERPLSSGINKKVIGKFKDELGGKIMKELVALRAKTQAYLMEDDSEHKRAKGTKKMHNKKRAYVCKL